MGLLDRAVDKLKAEEALAKQEPAHGRPLTKPKRTEPTEMARESSSERERRSVHGPAPAHDIVTEGVPDRVPEMAPEVPLAAQASQGVGGDHGRPGGLSVAETIARGGRVAVDLDELAKLGFAVPGYPQDIAILDEHRRIKRSLLFNAAVEQLEDTPHLASNLVLITSAVAGEGKTFCSINLAFVLSLEVDRQTLLVDADLIRSGASRLLGLQGFPGLVDYLAGEVDDINDLIIRPEGIDNLQVLPAGTRHENVNELLASDRMKELVEELSLADLDRLVVIDSPPLLMTSETGLLTRYAGQIALVVRADSTARYTVDLALAQIPPERFAGLILNDAARNRSMDGYSEYYED